LSILISDYFQDGVPDLIIGNDFEVPDFYYRGTGGGELELIKRKDKLIERSTLLTMSAATADIDNDLRQEIYMGNASGTDHSDMTPIEDLCAESEGTDYFADCEVVREDQTTMHASLRRSDPFMCSELSSPSLAEQCIGMQLYNTAWWQNRPDICERLVGRFDVLGDICTEYFRVNDEPMGKAFFSMVPQAARRTNVLLMQNEDGVFVDKALEFNLREAGWVWNAQFADLDQDGWQDIYIANGMFFENTNDARESNHYFRNDSGKVFVDETMTSGLGMHAENSAYTYVDYDNDGDLDIIAVEALGPVWLFENNETANNAVSFELRDTKGNAFGVGSQVIATLDDGSRQLRELRLSGGFASFNTPMVHFGIGKADKITGLEVQWPTGESTTLEGDFAPGRRYIITRN
ncbi:MAG: CRTAC1 family protein, partial [Gammaproteobacteria bacterium]